MSFVKVNRTLRGPGKRTMRSRRGTRPKQEWVSTVHDLSVHKATPEELSRRHEIHLSRNQAAAQWELRERTLRRRHSQPASPSLGCAHRRLIGEVFSDQSQLQDVLARSDRAMAVVKDLFGDAPHRQTGFPNVTVAPGCEPSSDLPLLQRAEPPTQLSLLSQSIMDSQALNELDCHSEGECRGHESSPHSNPTSRISTSRDGLLDQQDYEGPSGALTFDPPKASQNSCPQSPKALSQGQQAALNATQAVQRVRPRTAQCERDAPSALVSHVLNANPTSAKPGKKTRPSGTSRRPRAEVLGLNGSAVSSLSGNQSSLEVLQGMLGEVEVELDSLEPADAPYASGTRQGDPSLTRFSMALVSNLGRLVHHLRMSRDEVRREASERTRLEEEVGEQRQLIDALTAESLSLREENGTLQKNMKDLEVRLDALVLALGEPGGLGDEEVLGHEGSVPGCVHSDAAASLLETDLRETTTLIPAIMLSPPRQTDRHPHHGEVTEGQLLQYHIPSARGQHTVAHETSEYDESQASSSSPSFVSLPRLSSRQTSHGSLTSEPGRDLALQRGPSLSQQNTFIQTEQVYLVPRGGLAQQDCAEASPPLSGTERTVTPSWTAQHRAQQAPLPAGSSVTNIQQRLLELNMQSAAARERLLELIQQQRQETGGGVSPSISPIPPLDAEKTLGASVSLPEHDLDVYTHTTRSLGERTISPLNQADKARGQGWFALSAHMK